MSSFIVNLSKEPPISLKRLWVTVLIKMIGFLLVFLCFKVWALVPIEGILMGEAQNEYQQDPLSFIFSSTYDHSSSGENKKVKLLHSFYRHGSDLHASCSYFGPPVYVGPWQEKQAKRTVLATLQYLGLDLTIKAIGAYAKKLEVSEEGYKNLTKNIVQNYCSKNTTVYSLRKIQESLDFYYKRPEFGVIPSVDSSPFASQLFKSKTESREARSREFDYAIRSFRSLCSWGGDVEDFRMLAPYVSNKFIMAFVNNTLMGMRDTYQEASQSIALAPDKVHTAQVLCEDLICRKTTFSHFQENFSYSVGSTGVGTDISKLYCHHFRFQSYNPSKTIPEVKAWMKEDELEDPILETNFFISLMTGVPDPLMGMKDYREIVFMSKSSMDERWNKWAQNVLGLFSRDLLFEESLKVKAVPRRDSTDLHMNGFFMDFNVSLGEMDRLMNNTDKLGMSFHLKLSKNYLRNLRMKQFYLTQEIDLEGQKNFKQDVANYIEIQLKEKEKLFSQVMWNKEFSRLIAEELLGQVMAYQGPLFDSYKDEMLIVPLKFSFGVFALSYLRYRAEVKTGRLKLNL